MIPVDLYVNPMSKGKEYINKSARYQKAHDANFNTPDLHVRFSKGDNVHTIRGQDHTLNVQSTIHLMGNARKSYPV